MRLRCPPTTQRCLPPIEGVQCNSSDYQGLSSASSSPRYLYVELEDPHFGERAAFVHGKLQAAPPAGQALDSIGRQMAFVAQLRSISVILKVPQLNAPGCPKIVTILGRGPCDGNQGNFS